MLEWKNHLVLRLRCSFVTAFINSCTRHVHTGRLTKAHICYSASWFNVSWKMASRLDKESIVDAGWRSTGILVDTCERFRWAPRIWLVHADRLLARRHPGRPIKVSDAVCFWEQSLSTFQCVQQTILWKQFAIEKNADEWHNEVSAKRLQMDFRIWKKENW